MAGSVNIPGRIVLKTFLRSFVLQGSWNFERLQGLGALYVMAPALKHFYQGHDRLVAFRRHLGYFNTHPFLATSVLGTVIHQEGRAASGTASTEDLTAYRQMVMAPYTAMGDALFWGGLRPLAACMALFFAVNASAWAPVVFLLVFNIPHLWFRWTGLVQGCREGFDSIELMQKQRLPDLAVRLKEVTVVLLGGLCACLMFVVLEEQELSPGWAFGCLPVISLLGWLARRGLSTLLLVWIGVAVTTMIIVMAF